MGFAVSKPVPAYRHSFDAPAKSLADGIELKHLRYALLAADLHSFAKAAAMLRVKQATISGHISYLERRLEAVLFVRSTRGIVPTEAGLVFLESARRVMAEMEGLHEKTRAIGHGTAGTIGIGFMTSITAGSLRSSLIKFGKSYPAISLRYVESDRRNLHSRLDVGSLDILIISGSNSYPDTQRMNLWGERMYVAMHAAHPLASREHINWSELQNATFIAPRTVAEDVSAMVQARLARPGYAPVVSITDLSREAILGIISTGEYITIIGAGSTGVRMDNVVYRELFDQTGPQLLSLSAYWRSDNRNPALQTFLSFVQDQYSLTS